MQSLHSPFITGIWISSLLYAATSVPLLEGGAVPFCHGKTLLFQCLEIGCFAFTWTVLFRDVETERFRCVGGKQFGCPVTRLSLSGTCLNCCMSGFVSRASVCICYAPWGQVTYHHATARYISTPRSTAQHGTVLDGMAAGAGARLFVLAAVQRAPVTRHAADSVGTGKQRASTEIRL